MNNMIHHMENADPRTASGAFGSCDTGRRTAWPVSGLYDTGRRNASGTVKLYNTGRHMSARAVLTLLAAALAVLLTLALRPVPAYAMDAGAYLVTVKPSYTDPENGSIEDPGNNAAIGQGMTERLCGSTGLLEVGSDGSMWLTVRYYLSQFVSDVSFEERSGGSYRTLSYQTMQTKAPVDGATEITEKYGFTDYRMPITSLDSVFRGKAYIEPMGRNVVYFFTASSPVSGSGDFITTGAQSQTKSETAAAQTAGAAGADSGTNGSTGSAGSTGTGAQNAASQTAGSTNGGSQEQTAAASAGTVPGTQGTQDSRNTGAGTAKNQTGQSGNTGNTAQSASTDDRYRYYPEDEESWDEAADSASGVGSGSEDENFSDIGSGDASDPVTGIPAKPGTAGTGTTGLAGAEQTSGAAAAGSAGTASPEARKYGKALLKNATGITMTVGDSSVTSGYGEKSANKNRTMMYVLLGAAAVCVLVFIGTGALHMTKRRREKTGREESKPAADTDEIERKEMSDR